MKLHYYPETDTLHIQFKNESSTESEEIADDVVIDFDADGKIVSIDIEHASQVVDLSELDIESFPETLQPSNQEARGTRAGYYFFNIGTDQDLLSRVSQDARRPRQTSPNVGTLARRILEDTKSSEDAKRLAASVLSQQASLKDRDPRSRRNT